MVTTYRQYEKEMLYIVLGIFGGLCFCAIVIGVVKAKKNPDGSNTKSKEEQEMAHNQKPLSKFQQAFAQKKKDLKEPLTKKQQAMKHAIN